MINQIRNTIICAVILLLLLSSISSAIKHHPLVNRNEEVLISFKLVNSEKIATVARSIQRPEYIVYRFGKESLIELEYPKDLSNSWGKFTYSYYFRGGGAKNSAIDINYLAFTNGIYTYTIYHENESEDGATRVGIRVKNNNTKKEVDLKGDYSSLEGSLIQLRAEDRIKIEYL